MSIIPDAHIEPEFGMILPEGSSAKKSGLQTHIIVLTRSEHVFVAKMLKVLETEAPLIGESIKNRLDTMKRLAGVIARFPSLLERKAVSDLSGATTTLLDSLLVRREGDKMLHLPTKATLGKGFLAAKFRLFMFFSNLAQKINMGEKDIRELKAITSTLLFTMMAEDVYLNLLDDDLPLVVRRQVAMALIILWEHRTDFIAKDIAPVLQAVWDSRKKLAPVFGSMMGAAELLQITMEQDAMWNEFLGARLQAQDVTFALEEFLFGISYEQIQRLKALLAEKGVHTIDREKIALFLGAEVKINLDADERDFYMLYTVRRDNARARKRLRLPGPHNTLEDYYMRFALEKYKEVILNDIFL